MYFVSVALLPCCYNLLVLLLLELLLSDPFTSWYTRGRVRVPLFGSGSFQARASLRLLRGERARTCIRKLAGSARPPSAFARSPTSIQPAVFVSSTRSARISCCMWPRFENVPTSCYEFGKELLRYSPWSGGRVNNYRHELWIRYRWKVLANCGWCDYQCIFRNYFPRRSIYLY